MRKFVAALLCLWPVLAFGQAPAPVPALPDAPRLTTYNISATTCACSVGFQLYGDGTDVDNWIQVYIGSTQVLSTDPVQGWTITSPTGSIGAIARPITDAVLTFNVAQTGQITIIGAQRPRRLSQFSENRGIAARDYNQVLSTLFAETREGWDKTNRSVLGQPGETFPLLPPVATRKGSLLGFDSSTGLPALYPPASGVGALAPNSITFSLLQQGPANTTICNPTGSTANFTTCTVPVLATVFGADPTGAADSTAAFNAALAASNYVIFPPGKYKLNSAITYTIPSGIKSVTIVGAGSDVTTLFWPNAAGGLTITYNGLGSSAHVRDLSFTTGTTAGGNGLALSLSAAILSSADTAISDVSRVTFRGDDGYGATDYWTAAISVQNVSNIQFDTVTAVGPAGINGAGIALVGGTGSNFSVVYNITKSAFTLLSTGIQYGNNIQGVTVDQSNFTGGGWGILVPGGGNNLAQLSVTNSQFNTVTAATGGIGTASNLSGVQIVSNLFIPSANTIGIDLAVSDQFAVVGNEVGCASTTGSTGILVGTTLAGTKGTVSANQVTGCGTGISLLSTAIGTFVQANVLTNNTTPVNNASAAVTNFIRDNPGYNPVGPSGITVTASPFTYTAGASPESVYITAGTVSAVAVDKNGGALTTSACAASPCAIELGPFEQAKVTYTVAPTMNKMIH